MPDDIPPDRPPYLSLTTLLNFLDRWGDGPIPPRIDKSALDKYSGGFQALAYAPYGGLEELRSLEPKGGNDQTQGRIIYERTCGVCHQPSGLGAAGQFPPLANSDWVNEPDPARLIRIALDGAQGPIPVNGQEWNLIMSINGKQLGLSDQDLAAVLSYVRQAGGNGF